MAESGGAGAGGRDPSATASPGPTSLKQRIENNLTVALATVLVAGIGIGWAASEKIRVEPRDFENDRLQLMLTDRGLWGNRTTPDSAESVGEVPVRLEIVTPRNGDTVDITQTIEGTYSRPPTHRVPWIAVYSHPDRLYYPHESPATLNPDGSWTAADVSVGTAGDVGRTFEIFVMLVDSTGVGDLEEYLQRRDRAGMRGLPTAELHDRVVVTRR